MRSILSMLFIMVIMSSQAQTDGGIQFTQGSWDAIKQLAKDQNKPIFIDCYTSWCGPCKMLSKKVFTQPQVGQLFNDHFINFKIDMEKGEGPALKSQYKVAAYPTLIWVDANGNELHKSVGAPNADELLQLATQVLDGKGLAALARNYSATPNCYTTMLQYIEALNKAYDKQAIGQVLQKYFTEHKGKELLKEANYHLIKYYLNDIYSPTFKWFDKHQKAFKQKYSEEEIEVKLYQSYLSYGQSLISKNTVDYEGFERYKKVLNKRTVKERNKIIAFVQESIYRAESNWDAYIEAIRHNLEMQYYEADNAFLYYNWARAIGLSETAASEHYLQAALWMEKAFEVSTWPLQNNIVYLNEKLKLLKKANTDAKSIEALTKRIEQLKRQANNSQ